MAATLRRLALHDVARGVRLARAARRLGARRQRLDGLPPRLERRLRPDRAPEPRAFPLRVDRPEPGREDADADAPVGRLPGELALLVRPGRLCRPQRAG